MKQLWGGSAALLSTSSQWCRCTTTTIVAVTVSHHWNCCHRYYCHHSRHHCHSHHLPRSPTVTTYCPRCTLSTASLSLLTVCAHLEILYCGCGQASVWSNYKLILSPLHTTPHNFLRLPRLPSCRHYHSHHSQVNLLTGTRTFFWQTCARIANICTP